MSIILYDAAIHYRKMNRWSGWPPAIMGALLGLIKTASFAEVSDIGTRTIDIVTMILTVTMTLWSTIHFLLDYSGKKQRCKDVADDLYSFIQDIKKTRAEGYLERTPSDKYLEMIKDKISAYKRELHLLPRKIFEKYYPSNVEEINDKMYLENSIRPILLDSSDDSSEIS